MASGAVSANVREELELLEAAGDDLSKRAAAALQTLMDDLAKAHADAASSAVNNEQRFHQLEQETVAARSETERMTKLKDDSERKREHSEARIASLSNEVTAANAKAANAVAELRRMAQQLEEAKRDKEELVSVQDRHVQDAERAKTEATQLRKHAQEREQERLKLTKDLDEAREAVLKAQSQLNAADTKLKYNEAELKQTSERLSEKSAVLSKHLAESQATRMRLERELASERSETARLSALAEQWKKSSQEQSEACQRHIEKAQTAAQEKLAVQASLQMDLDNKTKLLQLSKKAQEDAEKEMARVQALSAESATRLHNMERMLKEERSDAKHKMQELEERLVETERKLTEAQEKVKQMVAIGSESSGNGELLKKILASSPAAVAAEYVREGRMADVYKVLEDTCELLHKERHERLRAEQCLSEVVKELQDKGPAILRQRQEWESAILANQATNSKLEAALSEMQVLRAKMEEIKVQRDRTMSDAASLERENYDLKEQCKALLRAAEEYRQQMASPAVQRAGMVAGGGGSAAASGGAESIGKGTDAQSYITKQLLTFRNVEELQEQNQKLLKVVRQLSADMDREAEVRKEELRAEFGSRVEAALREVEEIRSKNELLEAENESLSQQRDMYRILLAEADRSYLQADEDDAAAHADGRAAAVGSGAGSSSEVVSPSAARARSGAADAVRKVQQEMKELRERSESLLQEARDEVAAMREEKTKSTLACAQAQSDCSFFKERMESFKSTNDALTKEVNDLRARASALQGELGAAEGRVSECINQSVAAKQREQEARELLVAAEAGKKHAEQRIQQLEGDLIGLKNEKAQIHNSMAFVKTMHEEDAKRYEENLSRLKVDQERKEKDWADARTELAQERSRVDELRVTSEHKLSELRNAVRKAEEEASDLRTDKIRLEADVKATSERASLLERQLESAETRFRDALSYQQRAAEVAGSPAAGGGAGGAAAREGGGAGAGVGGDEVALMSSRLVALESENASLQKQLQVVVIPIPMLLLILILILMLMLMLIQELKMHRDNWHTMASQNEEALRGLRAGKLIRTLLLIRIRTLTRTRTLNPG